MEYSANIKNDVVDEYLSTQKDAHNIFQSEKSRSQNAQNDPVFEEVTVTILEGRIMSDFYFSFSFLYFFKCQSKYFFILELRFV